MHFLQYPNHQAFRSSISVFIQHKQRQTEMSVRGRTELNLLLAIICLITVNVSSVCCVPKTNSNNGNQGYVIVGGLRLPLCPMEEDEDICYNAETKEIEEYDPWSVPHRVNSDDSGYGYKFNRMIIAPTSQECGESGVDQDGYCKSYSWLWKERNWCGNGYHTDKWFSNGFDLFASEIMCRNEQ